MLGLVLTFTYLNTIMGQLMLAAERTYALNVIMLVAAVATMPLHALLVTWSHTVLANGALGGRWPLRSPRRALFGGDDLPVAQGHVGGQ